MKLGLTHTEALDQLDPSWVLLSSFDNSDPEVAKRYWCSRVTYAIIDHERGMVKIFRAECWRYEPKELSRGWKTDPEAWIVLSLGELITLCDEVFGVDVSKWL